ncbi:MAG: alpha/beta hydrolase [Polyangia bacterium]
MAFTIDPEVAFAMKRLAALVRHTDSPAIGDVALRRKHAADYARFSVGLPGPPDVMTCDLETRGHDGATVKLRWYERRGGVRGPAALYVHGGGMIMGGLEETHLVVAGYVAESGVPMLAVDYRLAPEHPHPTPVEDCYAALQFLALHEGCAPSRLAVMGDSAGGGLAAATALLARDRGGPAIARQLLVYPMLDDRTVTVDPVLAPFVTWSAEDNVTGWRALLGPRPGDAYAAPARAQDLSRLPPAYVEVGQLDLFCDEDLAYARRLGQAGVDVELHVHPGCPHGFDRVAPRAAVTRRAMADRIRVLKAL